MKIETVFHTAIDHPAAWMYENSVLNALKRVFPNPLFLDHVDEKWMHENLPLLKCLQWDQNLSIFLLSESRPNMSKFFYDMVSRWLVPGQRLDVSFFFAADFRIPEVTSQVYTLTEMVVRVEEEWEWEQNLRIIETEVRLGMVSVYHASRILEIRGAEKSSVIQEKITSLLQRRPDDVDYDIFGEMQHFLVMSKDEFRLVRGAAILSRIIAVFYHFRKSLTHDAEMFPDKRHLKIKLGVSRIELPWGVKKVLSIFVGLNFLKQNEIFEERHLIKALKSAMPGVKPIDDAFYVHEGDDDQIHTLYLEVEKEDGTDFSLDEVKTLRRLLAVDLKQSIEVAMRPLFMPRNEEEILRDIVTLAGQLKFVRDMPQLIVIFDEQTENDLCFTVIFVRVLLPGFSPIQDLFQGTFLTFIPDRVKRIGIIRKKYPKEATVFRVRFSAAPFFRTDHSVDLYKARQVLVSELQRILGEVRDYNGGMLSKQIELFAAFKEMLSSYDEHLLERFFHALYPVEMRAVLSAGTLKEFFLLWQNLGGNERDFKTEDSVVYYIGKKEFSFGPHQFPEMRLASLKIEHNNENFFGCLYFSEGEVDQDNFLSLLDVEAAKPLD